MSDDALCDLSAVELLARYRSRTLSPVEVTEAVMARAEAVNPKINALYLVDAEGALAAARESEARWRDGEPAGALDGVPVTIKDGLAVRGMPSPRGTAANRGIAPAEADAPSTARLREAGAVILGKTTMPDFGMFASGISSLYGPTRNPWNLARNPGGSSSGAGAAVAAGIGPLATGTDIGGSVRIPAAYCGIFGLKPSQGRVPYDPPSPGLCCGPMARSVADAALMLSVLGRPDPRDFTALPYDPVDYAGAIAAPEVRGLRLGLLLDAGFGMTVDPEVADAVRAAGRLFETLGAAVEPMPPLFDADPAEPLLIYFRSRAYSETAKLSEAQRAEVVPELLDFVAPAPGYSAQDLFAALDGIGELRGRVIAATAPYDFVLSPVMPVPPYAAEAPYPDPELGLRCTQFTAPINQSEQPAASINCGVTADGLPIGLHIVGRRFDDRGVLRLAAAYEAARPAQRPWPTP